MDGRPARPVNVNLTTPQDHEPDRAVERIAGALQHSGWEATVIEDVRPDHPMSRSVSVSGRGLVEPVVLTTTMMPEYTKPPTQYIDGLAVSPLPTLLLRVIQQVQLRVDARDFIDLVAIEEALGPDAVDRATSYWLNREARRNPDVDTARLYETLHYGLSRVLTINGPEMASHGIYRSKLKAVQDRVVAVARRVAEQVPGGEGSPPSSLQRLLSMSDEELAEMRAAAAALGLTPDAVERRITSPAAMAEQRRLAEREALAASAEQRVRTLQPSADTAHQHELPDTGVRRSMN
jgi:hypothetical protein